MRKKRVLYAAAKYSYANPELGFSYEHYNFLDSIRQIKNIEVKEFDWVATLHKKGRTLMNKNLVKEVSSYKPDLVFFSLFRYEFDKKVIEEISQKTLTFNWFNDDVSRFDHYIRHWAPLFTWVSTITKSLIPRYHGIGCKNVLHSQFAGNPRLYQCLSQIRKYDVSFVGQTHSNRKRIIHELKTAGVDVETWGKGWPNGVVNFKEMIKIFNQSKINLNLTTFSFSFPLGKFLPWFFQPVSFRRGKFSKGINGRIFEVLCCGGFLLTETAPHLKDYFEIGKELVVFYSLEDLKRKVNYYLNHPRERSKIAQAGYQRVIKDNTYKKRFAEIFKTIGLL